MSLISGNLNSSLLVCRLCIKLSDTFHPIEYIKEPLECILPNLDLSLTYDPVVVCSDCVTWATQCYTLITNEQNKLKSKKEYQELLTKSTYVRQEIESKNVIEIFKSDVILDRGFDIYEKTPLEENYKPKIVGVANKVNPYLFQPLERNLLESQQDNFLLRKTNRQICCLLCNGKNFINKQHLSRHLLTKHKDIPDIENIVTSKIHYCPICSFRTVRNYELAEHIKYYHGQNLLEKNYCKPFPCKHCERSFVQKDTLQLHIIRCHEDEAPLADRALKIFVCNPCQYETLNKQIYKIHLNKHIRYNNVIKYFSCEHCDKSFGQKNKFRLHILRCHEDEAPLAERVLKIFVCDSCQYETLDKQKYKFHLKKHYEFTERTLNKRRIKMNVSQLMKNLLK